MRTIVLGLAAAVLVLAGCGDDALPGQGRLTTLDTEVVSIPSSEAGAPKLDGNAATNPACAAITEDEIERIAGMQLVRIYGYTGRGVYAAESHQCNWNFALTPEAVSPRTELVFERLDAAALATRRQDIQGNVDGGSRRVMPGVGDLAAISTEGTNVLAIAEDVSLQLTVGLKEGDNTEQVTALLNAMLPKLTGG